MPKKSQTDKNSSNLLINCKSCINKTITDIELPISTDFIEEDICWYDNEERLSVIRIKRGDSSLSTYNVMCKSLFYTSEIFLIFTDKNINILVTDDLSLKSKKEINISSNKYDGFQLYTTHLVLFNNENIVSIINIKI